MRLPALALCALVLSSCGLGQSGTCPTCAPPPPLDESSAVRGAAWQQSIQEAANRDLSGGKPRSLAEAREAELLERALTGSPDYTAAVRRAAVANVDAAGEPSPAGRRNRADVAQAREQRISAEEARLSDEIEKRRRARLAANDAQNRSARDQQAAAACQARSAQMEAAYFNPRALVNLDGMVAGAQARNACLDAYQRTGILP